MKAFIIRMGITTALNSLFALGYSYVVLIVGGTQNWVDVVVLGAWLLLTRPLYLNSDVIKRLREKRFISTIIVSVVVAIPLLAWVIFQFTMYSDFWTAYFDLRTIIQFPISYAAKLGEALGIYKLSDPLSYVDFNLYLVTVGFGFSITLLSLLLAVSSFSKRKSPPKEFSRWSQIELVLSKVTPVYRKIRKPIFIILVLIIISSTGFYLYQSIPDEFQWSASPAENLPAGDDVVFSRIDRSSDILYGETQQGLYLSRDFGRTWSLMPNTSSSVAGSGKIISNGEGYLVMSGVNNGYYTSLDDGKTWNPLSIQTSEDALAPVITNLYPGQGDGVLLALSYSVLYLSLDHGNTWNKSIDTTNIVASNDGSIFFANTLNGWQQSTDNGQTWQTVVFENNINNIAPGINSIVTSLDQKRLFINASTTWNGLRTYYSDNRGISWKELTLDEEGTSAVSVVASPDRSVLIANAADGMYRSDDNGITWGPATVEAIQQGTTFSYATTPSISLLYSNQKGDILFAKSQNYGQQFISLDAGYTWSSYNTLQYNSIVSSPDNKELFLNGPSGVYRSTDEGLSWERFSVGLEKLSINGVRSNDEYVYIIPPVGLQFSKDNGRTWNSAKGLDGVTVSSIVQHPRSTSIFANSPKGLYVSIDKGETWKLCSGNTDIASVVNQYSISSLFPSEDGQTLFISNPLYNLLVSHDNGQTWQSVQNLTGLPSGSITLNAEGKRLFINSINSVYFSDDSAKSWKKLEVTKGDEEFQIYSIVPSNYDKTLFAITNAGVYYSTDRGDTWNPAKGVDAPILGYAQIVADETGKFLIQTSSSGVFLSVNGGRDWQNTEGLSATAFPQTAKSIIKFKDNLVYLETTAGIFESMDNGNTWQQSISPGGYKILSIALSPDKEYIFETDVEGLLKSSDGITWERVNDGIRTANPQIVAKIDNLVFLKTNTRLYASSDNGNHWLPTNIFGPSLQINSFVASPTNEETLFVTTNTGVFRSLDSGKSWSEITNQLGTNSIFYGAPIVVADKKNSRILGSYFAGTIYVYENEQFKPLAPGAAAAQCSLQPSIEGQNVFCAGNDLFQVVKSDTAVLEPYHMNIFSSLAANSTRLFSMNDTLYANTISAGMIPVKDIGLANPDYVKIENGKVKYYSLVDESILSYEEPDSFLRMPLALFLLSNQTRRVIDWSTQNRSLALSLIILTVFLWLVYRGVIKTNQFSLRTQFQLVLRPNYLLASINYRDYVSRYKRIGALEEFLLHLIPAEDEIDIEQLQEEIKRTNVPFDLVALQSHLTSLETKGFLRSRNNRWQHGSQALAKIHRLEAGDNYINALAENIRMQHPLFMETQVFLESAGFTVRTITPSGFICESDNPFWQRFSPVYVHVIPNRVLDMDEFQSIRQAVDKAIEGANVLKNILVVIDHQPLASDLHQVFALRFQEELNIILVSKTFINQAILDNREMQALRDQIDQYEGRTDLYDIRTAVSDVLSFFGRQKLLAEIQKKLTAGRSTVLFGIRKAGKSSLLARLREEITWPIASVDIEGFAGNEYSDSLSSVFVEAVNQWINISQVRYPDFPISSSDVLEWQVGEQGGFRNAVSKLLNVLAQYPQRPGLLLFLDEMDLLEDAPGYVEFAATLRSIIDDKQWNGRFAVLMAGLEPFLNRIDHFKTRRNPFFSLFEEQKLEYLENEDIQNMIIAIGGQMGITYSEDALGYLATIGGGHPFITRQICSYAIKGLERPTTITLDQAVSGVDGYMRIARNYFAESLWAIDRGGPPQEESSILSSLARVDFLTEKDLFNGTADANLKRKKHLAIDHLLDQNIIRYSNQKYEIAIPLYRTWIRRYILTTDNEGTQK